MSEWKVSEAKARFSEMLESCVAEPQVIFKHKKPVAVVMDVKDYEEMKPEKPMTVEERRKSLEDFFRRVDECDEPSFDPPPRTSRPIPDFEE